MMIFFFSFHSHDSPVQELKCVFLTLSSVKMFVSYPCNSGPNGLRGSSSQREIIPLRDKPIVSFNLELKLQIAALCLNAERERENNQVKKVRVGVIYPDCKGALDGYCTVWVRRDMFGMQEIAQSS